MKERYPLLLGGKHIETPDMLDVINPFDEKKVSSVCRASVGEASEAVEAADKSKGIMADMPSHMKAKILENISSKITERREELARCITLESGKPISAARTEAERGALTFKIASEEALRIGGEFIPLDRNAASEKRWGVTRRFPAGPVLAITPFNFPLNLVAHKLAPAIAAGNPVILKPASKTPVTALMLGDIIMDSGLPEGGLSVLPCSGDVAERMLADKRIKMLSFTGSASVGWRLKSMANQKTITLELGGNAGVIIDEECDLDYAVAQCVTGAFVYSGQVCISVQRIYAHEKIYDRFKSLFLEKMKTLKIGDPLDDATFIGPMIDNENLKRVDMWVNEAVEKGAKILAGGKRTGNFYEPTVLSDTTPEMKVNCMEVFAPVVTLEKIRNFEEGLQAVNNSEYGLQAGVFTKDLRNAYAAFEKLEVGGVIINDIPNYRVDHMPYGGVKMSGFGREGLRFAIEQMTELRLMVLNLK
ncbi:MAG: aldehyde dehydrogenase family protein [Nitrospirae bacterium]|nr:aldehyde dehydrogenase family protein [Nitrospirota bacterium]